MNRWRYFNSNPKGLRVGDCTIRAITKAMGIDWETAAIGVAVQAFLMSNMPSANCVWGRFLTKNGFTIYPIDANDKTYTVNDFCVDNPVGTYILGIGDHVVCVKDGFYYDTWDSGEQRPIYYFVR